MAEEQGSLLIADGTIRIVSEKPAPYSSFWVFVFFGLIGGVLAAIVDAIRSTRKVLSTCDVSHSRTRVIEWRGATEYSDSVAASFCMELDDGTWVPLQVSCTAGEKTLLCGRLRELFGERYLILKPAYFSRSDRLAALLLLAVASASLMGLALAQSTDEKRTTGFYVVVGVLACGFLFALLRIVRLARGIGGCSIPNGGGNTEHATSFARRIGRLVRRCLPGHGNGKHVTRGIK